jgi:hypothetical protein
MVNNVNLTGMTAWNFTNKDSEWKQEKMNRGNFAEVLQKAEGKLHDSEMSQMREGTRVGRENLRSEHD